MGTRLTAAEFGLPDRVECPFCHQNETELHSAFGSQLSVSTYWCRRCRTAFEYIKPGTRASRQTGMGASDNDQSQL